MKRYVVATALTLLVPPPQWRSPYTEAGPVPSSTGSVPAGGQRTNRVGQ
jgi:hypothetical protein